MAAVPASLKLVQPYFKVAKEYEKRDPVVAYYCRLYAVQKGIKTDSKSKEGKSFLFQQMDLLEKCKKEFGHEEAITSEIMGQTYMDEKATQLFLWADTEDRAARFNRNVVKSFYTASLLYDTLAQFGEPSEEAVQRQKYSKWKATYINKCLKDGTAPVPGPPGGDDAAGLGDEFGFSDMQAPPPSHPSSGESGHPPDPHQTGYPFSNQPPAQPPSYHQPSVPAATHQPAPPEPHPSTSDTGSSSGITSEDLDKAQKCCRYAQSALQYEDVKTAVDNLQKALAILQPH
ncbi:vacuolar protein sorting-associated protein VTA1 homolog [Actinia tenebrosa]|uniref:Vacuolar protein sorting-associated protein VTA1 homolog n=1 Tax=Actinia tenebrosa TaxID=6105 RepID=A0A6P8IUH1_ACTTE|nr:vacuolar protein sorting-associated protein VTA1 homolog [Actinia tenebrosa]